ncbi:MAG: trypsin-like serine protease [Gammaproteobacteria bacterium]
MALALFCSLLSFPVLAGKMLGAPEHAAIIAIPFVDRAGNHGINMGGGVVIGSHTVLTAAHVLFEDLPDAGGSPRKLLNLKKGVVGIAGNKQVAFINPDNIHFHPSVGVRRMGQRYWVSESESAKYLTNTKGVYDVALIRLDKPVGPFKNAFPTVAKGHAAVLNRYYYTGVRPTKADGGKGIVSIPTVVTQVERFGLKTKIAYSGVLGNTAVKPGDSGGALFVADGGRLKLYGLASKGRDSLVANESVFTRLDPIRGWIQSTLREFERDGLLVANRTE